MSSNQRGFGRSDDYVRRVSSARYPGSTFERNDQTEWHRDAEEEHYDNKLMTSRGRQSSNSYYPRYDRSPAPSVKSEARSTSSFIEKVTAVPYSMYDQADSDRRNTTCGNCYRKGHEVIECVKADEHGLLNACPIHNTRDHNLWTCSLRTTLSNSMIFEFLFELRRGIPQLAWGQDLLDKYRKALACSSATRNQGKRPLTRYYTLDMARKNPRYWEKYTYHGDRTNRLRWNDDEWDYPSTLESQIHPDLRRLENRITRLDEDFKRESSYGSWGDRKSRRRRSLSPPVDNRRRRSERRRSPLPSQSHLLDMAQLDYETSFDDALMDNSDAHVTGASSGGDQHMNVSYVDRTKRMENVTSHQEKMVTCNDGANSAVKSDWGTLIALAKSSINVQTPLGTITNMRK